ncbi:hypothetical protein PV11_06110 [Exophiala sideris]|uniref:Uncharacterized protein n=1 Tax=Exophiala sideris TaxID=1016849 RepID=A0A0D1YMM0_9EURO|nr:hypothetical protein PV11_06110 [Exophiala sideris]
MSFSLRLRFIRRISNIHLIEFAAQALSFSSLYSSFSSLLFVFGTLWRHFADRDRYLRGGLRSRLRCFRGITEKELYSSASLTNDKSANRLQRYDFMWKCGRKYFAEIARAIVQAVRVMLHC